MKKKVICTFLVITLMVFLPVNNLMGVQGQSYPTEYGNPIFTLHLTAPNTNPARIEHTYMIADSLAEIGIEANVHILGWDVLLPLWFGSWYGLEQPSPPGAPPDGWDLNFIGWSTSVEPYWELYRTFDPVTFAGADNFGGYSNPDYDALGLAQTREYDPYVRAEMLYDLQEIFVADKPNSILYNPLAVWAMDEDLTGFDGFFSNRPEVWEGLTAVTTAMPGEPLDFNPILSNSYYDFLILEPMFETLYTREADVNSPNFKQIVPNLARDLNELVPVDPSDLTKGYTLTVDLEESYFADGHKVDGYDVAWTLQTLRHPDVNAAWRGFYESAGLTAVPEETRVIFHFPDPPAFFLEALNFPILPMHNWINHLNSKIAGKVYRPDSNYPLNKLPNRRDSFNRGLTTFGSGPYQGEKGKLQYDSDNQVGTLLAHEGSHTGYKDVLRYEVKVIYDLVAAIMALVAGEVQLLDANFGYASRRQELSNYQGLKVELFPDFGMQVMGYNFGNEHLAKQAVRQAIDLAIPRQDIIDQTLYGLGSITSSFIPVANPYSDPAFAVGGVFEPVYDPALARLILKEAGYPVDVDS